MDELCTFADEPLLNPFASETTAFQSLIV